MNEELIDSKKTKRPPSNLKSSKKINIEEAIIITDKTDEKDNIDLKIKNKDDKSYIENITDTKTIDLGEAGKKQSSEKVTIDFMNEDHIKDFTGSQTKKSEENVEKEDSSKISSEDFQKEIKQAEDDSTKNFTKKDFEDIAKFLIFLIDTGISSAMKWWSKDTSDAAYSLPNEKKKMLEYQLTIILAKYQAKFSIEFIFLLTICIVYAPAFIKAKSRRKDLKTEATAKINEQIENINNNATTVETTETKTEIVENKTKRKRGNPGKA